MLKIKTGGQDSCNVYSVFYPVGYELEFHAPFVLLLFENKSSHAVQKRQI